MSLPLLLIIFFIFLLSLCPTIYVGDSSLFAAASFSLGSAHPPGYPLYIILGKFLTFIPFGNVAFKVNLISAIFGALTCLMVYKVSMELTENKYASWASALICGISPVFFTESVKAEVYSLNSFLSMVVFYLGLRILKGGDFVKNTLLGFFIIGLGMGNHQTIGFMGLIFLFPLAIRWKDIKVKWILLSILAFSIGFSVNLFLYLRSIAAEHSGVLINYSYAGTWENLLKVFLREDFQGASTPKSIAGAFSFGNAWVYGFKNSLLNVAFYSIKPALPFFFLGLIGLLKNKRILLYFIFSFIIWLGLVGRMVWGGPLLKTDDIQTISVYFLPVIPILYCFTSAGFSVIISFFKRYSFKMVPKVIIYAIIVFPFSILPHSLKIADMHKNPLAYDFGRDMLSVLPLKSIILNYDDNPSFITYYMKTVERFREDIVSMDTGGKKDIYSLESSPPWKYAFLYPDFYRNKKSTLKEMNRDFKGKIFANSPLGLTETVSQHYAFYPYLLSVALYPKDMNMDTIEGLKKDLRDNFKTNYEKINYEHAMELPFTDDFLVKELLNIYAFDTIVYGDFIERDGEEKKRNEFYKNAFLIGYPEKFLWPFINFLLQDGREKEAFALIGGLKMTKGTYRELADLLEQKAISIIKEEKTKN